MILFLKKNLRIKINKKKQSVKIHSVITAVTTLT